jgi:hypothetical protein
VVDFIGLPGGSIENVSFYDFDGPQADGLNIWEASRWATVSRRVRLRRLRRTFIRPGRSGGLLVAVVNTFAIHFRSNANRQPSEVSRFSTFGEGAEADRPPNSAWIDSVTGASPELAVPVLVVDESDASNALIKELDGNYDIYLLSPR